MRYCLRSIRCFPLTLLLTIGLTIAVSPLLGQSPGVTNSQPLTLIQPPSWVWLGEAAETQRVVFRKQFSIEAPVAQALITTTADNHCEVFINGKKVGTSDDWSQLLASEVANLLKPGTNTIAISAVNDGGPAGLLAYLHIASADGRRFAIVTDATWKATTSPKENWKGEEYNDAGWSNALVLGTLGDASLPWSQAINAEALTMAFASNSNAEFKSEVASNVQAPNGFKVEKVFQVPRAMGSWVSLTTDPKGRLIASDQAGAGLFLITPGAGERPTQVQKLPVKLSGAQGLLWAFDSLYAVVNGGDQSGLHRLRDSDGDGLVDSDEFCMYVPGGGEHGPHAVVLDPAGKSLYVAAGNHTKLPETVGSYIPTNWNEDLLLPRRWDANGHAAGILAPGGWICKVDPNGKKWEVFSIGYRNQYDIAFNGDGELFTYDSDMEWDFGAPWYRPTRICHVTSGSEFGWRSGTGVWPSYYEDSLPPVVEIGPGSPTGMVFGYGAKFPAQYQQACYILDWTYSTIYMVQMQPEGSTYVGKKQDFITGSPLPVTDAVVGQDGAMYFTVGGRGAQSALYRVTYTGSEPTEPTQIANKANASMRQMRHRLESSHGEGKQIDTRNVLSNLGNRDRFIRYAARVAMEHQPIDRWKKSAFSLTEPLAAMNAMLAVAHQGTAEDLPRVVERLQSLKLESLSESEKLIWLRVLQVAFARLGEPSKAIRDRLLARLELMYPSNTYQIDAELVQLLVYLQSPQVVAKSLALMRSFGPEPIPDWGYLVQRNAGYGGTVGKMLEDMPPARGIHFAFALRNVKSNWTMDERKEYFQFFVEAAKHPGGNSYAKFLVQIRDDAWGTCTPSEQIVLEPIASKSLMGEEFVSVPPKGPGKKWTTPTALEVVSTESEKRSFEAGRNLFHATSCAKCHRLNGEGGAIGPDLSTAAKKFSMPDLLDAIIEPSKVISDQYGSHQVATVDGKVIIGRAIEIGNQYYVYTIDADAKPIVLEKADVEEVKPSKVSQMPVGLIDSLNDDELRDLMAYIQTAGDRRHAIYRK